MKSPDFTKYIKDQLVALKQLEITELRYNLENMEGHARVFLWDTEGYSEMQLAEKCPLIAAENGDGVTYWYVTSVYIDDDDILCIKAVDCDNTIDEPELFYTNNIPVGELCILNEWICLHK